jgi:alpha-D-ribose 1-methylphosphonate 5-triphosphate diphosphatase PhnM
MDHTPPAPYADRPPTGAATSGATPSAMPSTSFAARRKGMAERYSGPHRAWMVALARDRQWPLASHDVP